LQRKAGSLLSEGKERNQLLRRKIPPIKRKKNERTNTQFFKKAKRHRGQYLQATAKTRDHLTQQKEYIETG